MTLDDMIALLLRANDRISGDSEVVVFTRDAIPGTKLPETHLGRENRRMVYHVSWDEKNKKVFIEAEGVWE